MTTYAYDEAGNLTSAIDAKGQQTSFAYDGMNRYVRQSVSGGADIVASYDSGPGAIGRISRIADGEGTASFAYDQGGRLAMETRLTAGRQHSIAYTWDNSSGDLLAMTYPSGLTLTLTRDAAGRVTEMRLGNEVLVSAATYLPFGPLKTAALGSVNLTRHYDQRYNLAMIEGGGLRHQYTRNALGNVTALADLATPPVQDAATAYTYNTANNQLMATAGSKAVAYSYDANGNMVSAGGRVFVYDGLNRLVKVEEQGAVVATYGYDSSNRRIRKIVGNTTTCYLYDINSQLIAESVDGTVVREYFYLDGQPLALREYQSNPGTYFFINDHLGTPQRLVTDSGTLVWQAIYSPFGKAERVTGSVQNNLRFPGQFFDAETGLHYNWHRFYDPETGRYVSADPIGLDGEMNLYAYTGNIPTNKIDLNGLAYFAKRNLAGLPWMGIFSSNPGSVDDMNNSEISYEQLFFEDNKFPFNIGYFDIYGGSLQTDLLVKGYHWRFGQYNDCLMRKAVQNVPITPCKLLGPHHHNCQDYADAVRREYNRLLNDPEAKCECKI